MTESKYTITEKLNGFIVSGKDRNPVTVVFTPTCWTLTCKVPERHSAIVADQFSTAGNFYQYYRLSQLVAKGLMVFWQPPQKNGELYAPPWVKTWAVGQTAKAIGKRVHQQWLRCLEQVQPEVLDVHRKVFAAAPGIERQGVGFEIVPETYGNHYMVKDISNHRAAALTVALAEKLIRDYVQRGGTPYSIHQELTEKTFNALLENWDKWPYLYSDTRLPYRALTSTLINLPGGISPDLLTELPYTHLERPISDRLELTTLLAYVYRMRRTRDVYTAETPGENLHIFQHATREQIKTAMRRLSDHLRQELSSRRTKDILSFAYYLHDYPEQHTGNIVGLTDKAIDWHRHQQKEELNEVLAHYGSGQRLAIPPVNLPDLPGVKFLATIDDLAQEAEQMEHCVISYANKAVRGYCYLFHVDYKGEAATVEVAPDGTVVQSKGPRNRDNRAVKWAGRALKKWGAQIPEGAPPVTFEPEPVEQTPHFFDDPILGRIQLQPEAQPNYLPALNEIPF